MWIELWEPELSNTESSCLKSRGMQIPTRRVNPKYKKANSPVAEGGAKGGFALTEQHPIFLSIYLLF